LLSFMAKPESDNRKIQMADIARLAGVSTSTVSRALNGSPLINEETRSRISELARSLSYTINLSAKNLRSGENRTVGVVIPYLRNNRQHVTDPFFLGMLGSLADHLTDQNFDLLFSRIEADAIDDVAGLIDSGRVCGVIIIGQWGQHERLNQLARKRVPFVVWGGQLQQQMYCSVGSDNFNGGLMATDHLLNLGRKRVVFMGDRDATEVQQRYQGYLAAHTAKGLQADPALYLPSSFTELEAQKAMASFLQLGIPFDGVFAASDLIAINAMGVLGAHNISIPKDVSVVGYDDVGMAAHSFPPLTTIRQPIDLAGAALMDCLLKVIRQGHANPEVVPTELVVRASTSALNV
jgi:DNA-binding LacI/PurR family transcriptional regulator